jgi:hypothetical protein
VELMGLLNNPILNKLLGAEQTTVHSPVHSEISLRNKLVWVVQTTDCFEKSVQTTDIFVICNSFWGICNEEADIHNYFSGH